MDFGYEDLRIEAEDSQINLHNRRWRIWSSQCSSGWRVWGEVGAGREEKVASMAWWCEVRDNLGWTYLQEYSRDGWLVHVFRIGYLILELKFWACWKCKFLLHISVILEFWIKSNMSSKSVCHVWRRPRQKLCFTFELILWGIRDRTHSGRVPISMMLMRR